VKRKKESARGTERDGRGGDGRNGNGYEGKGLRTLGNEEEQKLKSEEREEVQKREMNERRNGKKQSKWRTGLAGDTRQGRLKDWEVADKERKSAALHVRITRVTWPEFSI